ncbi:hypothetical protein KKH27_02260 [bacterium]|nr:hypothetical protein [bacterium]
MLRAAFLFVTLTALVGVAMAVPGEDCSDPFDVTSLPVVLSGNTCSFLDDYEWACPYETEAVDVVYRYVPSIGQNVNFSLCSASYDTKLFVFENSCSSDPIACDDDGSGFCADASHAFIQGLALTAGYTYFIVVEGGYGFQCGDYELTISEHYPDRPCQSCTPVDADLGSITSITCGDSISGNLGSGGKWVASFTGEAGVTYVWDLCPGGTCPGYDNFGSDPDFIILDETCSILEWTDGQEWCSYRPDEWTWACQANGTYYIVVGSYPSISDDTLTCNGTGSDAFTMYYYARPGRLCASCTPVNADLGDITTAPCGASVTGDCGWGGKWIASFIGYQDVVYHWDLCAMEPCSGASEFGGTDADVVILDANCAIVEWHDGMEECGYRPNDYQWTCPASGNYYVVIAPYPAVQEDTLTCAGQADQTFTLVYWRDEGPIPGGETCDDATLISGPLPRTIRWNTCSYVNDYDV